MELPEQKRETGLFAEVWRHCNKLRAHARSLEVRQSGNRGVTVSRTSNGTQLTVPLQGRVSGEMRQFRLKNIENDYYVCREFDGTTEAAGDVNIARQEELRRTGWHGVTKVYPLSNYPGSPGQLSVAYSFVDAVYRTATATIDAVVVVEHQIIQPVLIIDSTVIFAMRVENGTGVAAADEWLAVDGRHFGKVA